MDSQLASAGSQGIEGLAATDAATCGALAARGADAEEVMPRCYLPAQQGAMLRAMTSQQSRTVALHSHSELER